MSMREYSKEGMARLYNLAREEYLNKNKVGITHLYRNKGSSYFADIINNQNAFMQPYLKDQGNDPFNPTNVRLGGLFFTAEGGYSESYQKPSYFGDTRFVIPVGNIMNDANVYFADFYCLQSEYHYVNLVVCEPLTRADAFCREKLMNISKEENPFLFKLANGEYQVIQYEYLNVEIFVTWPIDMKKELKRGAYIKYGVERAGMGSSKKGGLPKNSSCSLCNITDRSSYVQVRSSEKVIASADPAILMKREHPPFSFLKHGKYGINSTSQENEIVMLG